MSRRLTKDDENPVVAPAFMAGPLRGINPRSTSWNLRGTSPRATVLNETIRGFSCEKGLTLIELLIVILILTIIAGGLSQLLAGGIMSVRENRRKTVLIDDVNYAMNRIVDAARETNWVFIPTNAVPVRDILAISAMVDNDNDGIVDEDWGSDIGNDMLPGIGGIDDDGDGLIDEGGNEKDNDEDGSINEDIPKNGLDDDSDGNYDEEFRADMNGDGCPGICFRDDDGDGLYDEGDPEDDDEDGMVNEDPVDPLVFYLKNGSLYEKRIVWNPSSSVSDITEKKLIDHVTQFRVERLMGVNGKALIKIRIEVSAGRGDKAMFESYVHPRMLPRVTP